MSLNIPLRRAYIAAFWMISTLMLALIVAGISALRGRSAFWTVASVLPMLPRLAHAHWFETGVRIWNAAVRRGAVPLRRYILRVSYIGLFAPTGAAGTELDWALPSNWRLRQRSRPAPWLAMLTPVVWLLWVLRDDSHEHAPPSSTSYTLY